MTEDPTPEASPTWLERTRRLRLFVLLAILVGVLVVGLAKRSGHLAYVQPAPFTGRLELEHGVVVEQVDLLQPAARLVVARIPRGKGLGLRALLLDPERQTLLKIGPIAKGLDALVAINGDYHRLGGFCHATTYSTLVDGGRIRVLGAPFDYSASFWLDADGAPHIGRIDLTCRVAFPSGATAGLHLNLEQGDLVLVDRPPPGNWSAKEFVGVRVEGTFASRTLRVTGPPGTTRQGPALLARVGTSAETQLRALAPGNPLQLRLAGKQAGVGFAIGSGPRLLEGGAVHADAKLGHTGWVRRLIRTAVGFNDTEVMLVTTLQKSLAGISMVDLALALKKLGCTDAINLDGGPSSTLWADGRVLNIPFEEGDTPVASALCVVPPGAGTTLK